VKAEITEAITLWAQTRYGAFDAAVRYELLGAEGVVGRFFTTINPSDTASVLDSISFLLAYNFSNVVLVSTDQAELSIGKIIGDSPTTTDSIGLVSAYDRLLGDFVYLSDAINILLTTVRADFGLVVDAGQLLAQDYVDDPFYFADDYVGVKRIF
jgi:hypothetical protein